ncbi:MAG TPA: SRPBCC domain-containing protein [Candidatus Acidoferrum sp.]|nr:SRPBCC domain-containing protein [Candidatus Acidoferrum sp.]
MVPNAIEREILIDAPVDVVWSVVTEPEQIRKWFADEAEIELRVGGSGQLKFKPSGDSYQLQVEVVEPPRRFAFRWVQPAGTVVAEGSAMLVEFTLHPEAGGTRLRVVESGFDTLDWSDAKKQQYADNHSRGWQSLLARLRNYASTA